jgi:phosphoribosylanthranilate isomerase
MSVEVKICGITNTGDAAAALEAGADYLGFVLYQGSPRGITPDRLAGILGELRPERAVGVYVNASRSIVEESARRCGLWGVQIHGDEAAGEFDDFPLPVWRSLRSSDAGWTPRPGDWAADRYVVDAAPPGVYGGSGMKADWPAAKQLAGTYALMLAGGLTPDNVSEAVRAVTPVGVDVSSGVESGPGRKDHEKLRAFVHAAKHARY